MRAALLSLSPFLSLSVSVCVYVVVLAWNSLFVFLCVKSFCEHVLFCG